MGGYLPQIMPMQKQYVRSFVGEGDSSQNNEGQRERKWTKDPSKWIDYGKLDMDNPEVWKLLGWKSTADPTDPKDWKQHGWQDYEHEGPEAWKQNGWIDFSKLDMSDPLVWKQLGWVDRNEESPTKEMDAQTPSPTSLHEARITQQWALAISADEEAVPTLETIEDDTVGK
eukprot:4801601-Pyramimonas_sp.AAC.1